MSDLSFGSFPDLLESNVPSGELTNFEQLTTNEQNKCAVSINFDEFIQLSFVLV